MIGVSPLYNNTYKPCFQGKNNYKENNSLLKETNLDIFVSNRIPDGKAVQVKRKLGLGRMLLNIVTIPLGFFGFSTKPDLELIDLDVNNLTEKQKKLIKKGKIINSVPAGYHIEDDKIVKNR